MLEGYERIPDVLKYMQENNIEDEELKDLVLKNNFFEAIKTPDNTLYLFPTKDKPIKFVIPRNRKSYTDHLIILNKVLILGENHTIVCPSYHIKSHLMNQFIWLTQQISDTIEFAVSEDTILFLKPETYLIFEVEKDD